MKKEYNIGDKVFFYGRKDCQEINYELFSDNSHPTKIIDYVFNEDENTIYSKEIIDISIVHGFLEGFFQMLLLSDNTVISSLNCFESYEQCELDKQQRLLEQQSITRIDIPERR